VVLAHADPHHVRRLVDTLDPFPVFLHCDSRTSGDVYGRMVADLPSHCELLPRMRTGWARWENVAAELAGYRAALESTSMTHVALLTGSDYPLASTSQITDFLASHPRQSIARFRPLPLADWGGNGGLSRLRYRHWAFRKHMVRLPVPRRLPDIIRPAGGAQMKILARDHARRVLDTVDAHPELVSFWRRSWVADETFVGSVLNTPSYVPGWPSEHLNADAWFVGWSGDGKRTKSPPWLRAENLHSIVDARMGKTDGFPKLFARKFATSFDTTVLDTIDRSLRDPLLELSL
jgi:hypothetical protein